MDFETKHDQSLNLPFVFPGDKAESARVTTQQPPPPPQEQKRRRAQPSSQPTAPSPSERAPSPPSPTFTVYIRVPGLRDGFEDPPDINWNQEKDDALWQILSRASKSDINWEDLAYQFEATVDFLLIQANVLTRRHFSQVRAQTRKAAALGTRESPLHSPSPSSDRSQPGGPGAPPRVASRRPSTPSADAMARTLSGGGPAKRLSAEAMHRTSSAGISGVPSSGSRRPSRTAETGHPRPARPYHPSDRRPSNPTHARPRPSSLAIETSPPHSPNGPTGRRESYDNAVDDANPESPAATSSESSDDSSSSSPSLPVMSRIFKRPPGHPQQQDTHGDKAGGGPSRAGGTDARLGHLNLGLSPRASGVSDDGEESETQAAFLPFKSPTLAATSGTILAHRPGSHDLSHSQKSWQRWSSKDGSPSSSSSASPTAKAFRSPQTAPTVRTPNNATSAAAMAAARLQSSRMPGMRSPPLLQHASSSGRGLAVPKTGFNRDGSDTGTTPSMSSSFSDLDDVSLTQSVLDEALASRVEDTIITPGMADMMSSSGTNAASSSTTSRRLR